MIQCHDGPYFLSMISFTVLAIACQLVRGLGAFHGICPEQPYLQPCCSTPLPNRPPRVDGQRPNAATREHRGARLQAPGGGRGQRRWGRASKLGLVSMLVWTASRASARISSCMSDVCEEEKGSVPHGRPNPDSGA